jgi:hypothetical protein
VKAFFGVSLMNTLPKGKKFPEKRHLIRNCHALDRKSGKKKAKARAQHWPFGHSA